jgi:hypothetical protein
MPPRRHEGYVFSHLGQFVTPGTCALSFSHTDKVSTTDAGASEAPNRWLQSVEQLNTRGVRVDRPRVGSASDLTHLTRCGAGGGLDVVTHITNKVSIELPEA